MVAVSGQYVTVEQYVEAKYDLHIFKIGDFYRAMMEVTIFLNFLIKARKIKEVKAKYTNNK